MKISELKKLGKENMKFQWGASLLSLVIYAALLSCATIIPVIGNMLVLGPLMFGLYLIYFNASKKEKIEQWNIFKGFEISFGDTFLSQLLVTLFTVLWSLLFIIPGIIKSYAYSMTIYLQMREPGLDAMDAIAKSREYMNGNKMKMFLLDLSFIGWDILEVLTCGILAIYVEPWKLHSKMSLFNEIYDSKTLDVNNIENSSENNGMGELKVDPAYIVGNSDEENSEEWASQR